MGSRIQISLYGSGIDLDADAGIPEAWLADVLPPDAKVGEGSGVVERLSLVTTGDAEKNGLYRGGEHICGFTGFNEESAQGVEGMIQNLLALNSVPRFFFIHAGAVVIDGFGVIFPGRTHSGKSMLTRAFLDRGAVYFSDDCAVIARDGSLHPYRTPLKIRLPGNSRRRTIPAELPTGSHSGRVEIGAVVFTGFESDSVWAPSETGQGRAVWKLIENLFYPPTIRKFPGETFESLRKATANAILLSGPRGEAAQTADDVITRVLPAAKPGAA